MPRPDSTRTNVHIVVVCSKLPIQICSFKGIAIKKSELELPNNKYVWEPLYITWYGKRTCRILLVTNAVD